MFNRFYSSITQTMVSALERKRFPQVISLHEIMDVTIKLK